MKCLLRSGICLLLLAFSVSTFAQDSNESAADLRKAINQLRQEYESRIQALEKRVAEAEQQSANSQTSPQPVTATSSVSSGNSAFNPAMGVIFSGQAWNYQHDPEGYQIPGHPFGGEAGPVAEGLSIGETEIDISANVDDKFTAWLTTPIVIEDGDAGIELEEAWIETTALPAGFSARVGRFFSNIGYLNNKHAHAWDFIDQPLAYQAFLGGQYLDDGLQLRWLAPTDLYIELGGEVLRGDRYPAVGATHSGIGSHTLFAHMGGDVGDSNSWLAGVSYLRADSTDRISGSVNDPLLFTGNADIIIADFTWKWSPYGNWQQKNFVFQTEYLQNNEKGDYTLSGNQVLAYDDHRSGWHAQAIFQPFPQWRFGARYDILSAGNPGLIFSGTALEPLGNNPDRYSFMVDWSNSEFSRLRLQLTRDEAGLVSDTQFGLQYIYSIGAHGAHSF